MLQNLVLLFSVGFFFIAKNRYKNISNPYCVFNFLWTTVSLLIIIGNSHVYVPSWDAMMCVCVGTVAFNLSMFSKRLVIGNHGRMDVRNYRINTPVFSVALIVVLIFSIYTAGEAVRNFMQGVSLAEIRTEYFDVSAENIFLYYLRNYVMSPLRYVVIIITAFMVFGEQRKQVYGKLAIVLCIVMLQAIGSGGRYILMNTIFIFMCSFLLYSNRYKLSIKQKMSLMVIAGVFGYSIIYFTDNRSTHLMMDMSIGEKVWSTIYQYFAGSVTYLGEVMQTSPEIIGITHGVNLIAGFVSPVFAALSFFRIMPYPQFMNVIGKYACVTLRIGPSTYYNAMPTIFGYFYIDGGLFLTFIESWIFGYACKRMYERSQAGDILFVCMYILIFVQICNSSTRWFFYLPEFCLAFLYFKLFFISNNEVA